MKVLCSSAPCCLEPWQASNNWEELSRWIQLEKNSHYGQIVLRNYIKLWRKRTTSFSHISHYLTQEWTVDKWESSSGTVVGFSACFLLITWEWRRHIHELMLWPKQYIRKTELYVQDITASNYNLEQQVIKFPSCLFLELLRILQFLSLTESRWARTLTLTEYKILSNKTSTSSEVLSRDLGSTVVF